MICSSYFRKIIHILRPKLKLRITSGKITKSMISSLPKSHMSHSTIIQGKINELMISQNA